MAAKILVVLIEGSQHDDRHLRQTRIGGDLPGAAIPSKTRHSESSISTTSGWVRVTTATALTPTPGLSTDDLQVVAVGQQRPQAAVDQGLIVAASTMRITRCDGTIADCDHGSTAVTMVPGIGARTDHGEPATPLRLLALSCARMPSRATILAAPRPSSRMMIVSASGPRSSVALHRAGCVRMPNDAGQLPLNNLGTNHLIQRVRVLSARDRRSSAIRTSRPFARACSTSAGRSLRPPGRSTGESSDERSRHRASAQLRSSWRG